MNRNVLIGGGAALLVLVMIGMYIFVLGPTEEATEPIAAPTLAVATNTEEATDEPEPTAVVEPTADVYADDSDENTDDATEEATAEPEPTAVVVEEPAGEIVVFAIDQTQSEVQFSLDELLRGEPTTVIGSSDQVAGELAVNLADLSATQLGVININARTFATDSSNRDRAIRNFILSTDDFEFITFSPTEIIGLAGDAAVGDTVEFEVVGDLTIRDTTLSQRFAVEATVVSESEISGTATATIARGDYGLEIPSVPFVADVDEDVILTITFVAIAK